MDGYPFDWHGLRLEARASGALWWAEARWLVVADLHLGKSERMARRGGALLPPYEGLATLERLGSEIAALDPEVVVSLGDGFDDDAASEGLDRTVRAMLEDLVRARDWLWLTGNHDPLREVRGLPGRIAAEAAMRGVAARHEAAAGPDISGHFHPVIRLAGTRHRAFLIGTQHLILPAFGAYTGGLDAGAPALARLAGGGLAVACLHRAVPVPLARMAG